MAIRPVPPTAGFLGQGIAYPPRLDGAGRLALSAGSQSVEDALISILSTVPGERVMQPDYGAQVGEFEPVDMTRFVDRIQRNITEHEPRISTFSIETALGTNPGEVSVSIRYKVAGDATPRMLTYPLFVGPS